MMTEDNNSAPVNSEEMHRLWSRSAERLVWRRIWASVGRQRLQAAGADSEALLELARQRTKLGSEADSTASMGDDLKAFRAACSKSRGALDFVLIPSAFEATALAIRQRAALGVLLGALRDLLLSMSDTIDRLAEIAVPDPQGDGRTGFTSFGALIARTARLELIQYEQLVQLRARLGGVDLGFPPTPSANKRGDRPETAFDRAALAKELDLAAENLDLLVAQAQSGELLYDLALTGSTLSRLAWQLQNLSSPWPGVLGDGHPWPGLPIFRFWDELPSLASQFEGQLHVLRASADRAILQLNHAASPGSDIMRDACVSLAWMIHKMKAWLTQISIEPAAQRSWVDTFGPFAGVDLVGQALLSAGAPPEKIEIILRQHCLASYDAVRQGKPNPLADLLSADVKLLEYLQPSSLRRHLDPSLRLNDEVAQALATSAGIRRRLTPAGVEDRS